MTRKAKKKIDKGIWKTMMRRYATAIGFGLPLTILSFWQLHGWGDEPIPLALMASSVVGWLLVSGGLFGLVLSLFFHHWHKER